jgi:hypothetical protein
VIRPYSRPAGLALVTALLLLGPALTGCATQNGTVTDRPNSPTKLDPSRAPTGYATNYAVEEQLDQVIADIDQGREQEDIPGLAGLKIDAASHSLDLYWVGEPPERVRQVAAAPPPGITVNLHPATYDLHTMRAAIDEVFAAYGHYLHAASPALEGTGITVEWTAENAKKGPTPEKMTATAGLPVTTKISEPAEG